MGETKTITTFQDHIHALRNHLMYPALLFVAAGTAAYFYYPKIIHFIRGSLNQPLYYQTPAGNFALIMKICVICGLIVAVPALVYNLLRFVEPAFTKHVKRHTITLVSLLALILAIGGALFALYVIVPMSLHFFAGFQIDGVKPLLSANEYLNFVLNAVMSSVIMFQVPLVVLFIDFVHPIPPRKLLKFEKYVVIGALGLALILPFTYDPLTQFVIALPIIVLYNVATIMVAINHARRNWSAKKMQQAVQQPITKPGIIEKPRLVVPQPQTYARPALSMQQPVLATPVSQKVLATKLNSRKAFDVFS